MVAATVGAALAVLGLCACGSSQSSSVSAARTRPGPESIIEAQAQLQADPIGTLATLKRLGVDRVKVFVPWATLAPDPTAGSPPAGFKGSDPASYPAAAWTLYDTIVRAAASDDIGLDITLGNPAPQWATTPGEPQPGPTGVWKPSAKAFGGFVHAWGERYSGHYVPPGASGPLPRVSFWSVWNEPNYGPNLAPQATHHSTVEVSPMLYRKLLDSAWRALMKTGHGHDTILIGETAPRGLTGGNSPGNYSGMVPLRFIRALYCVDANFQPLRGTAATERGCPTTSARFSAQNPALFEASGFADHPYPDGGAPPNAVTPYEPDYADLGTLSHLESTLDRALGAYGDHRQLPIYDTEFGYQTNPPEKIAQITPKLAAGYLNWAEYISWRDPRVRSYDQYLLVDPPSGDFASGLELPNGKPKRTFYAFRMPLYLPVTRATHGQSLEVWGCVRPANYAQRATGKPQHAQVQFAPAGSHFKTLQTVTVSDAHGYFDVRIAFPSSGSVRVKWSYPHGPAIFSRTVAIEER